MQKEKLCQYRPNRYFFKTSDPDDMSQGALSRRVHYLKREEGGIKEMCEYSERIFNGGKEEGRREMQDEILRMIAGVSRQGSAEDVINEIINKIHSEGKMREESEGVL